MRREMNGKQSPIRIPGQRSIPSSFLSRSSNPFGDSKEDPSQRRSSKSLSMSFSDFLSTKLPEKSGLPAAVKGKSRPFSLVLVSRDLSEGIDRHIAASKEDEQTNRVINEVLFEQFKRSDIEKRESIPLSSLEEVGISSPDYVRESRECITLSRLEEVGIGSPDYVPESRKRKNPSQDGDKNCSARKTVLVLGGDPKPKQNKRKEIQSSNKRPRPLYNHYANGRGWWDSDMEGFESEEVGSGEVWEGIGSSTLGGMDWH